MKILNQTKYLSYDIIEYDVVDSTMNVVKNYADRTVVIANRQENGRGKADRKWSSDDSSNLYASIMLNADNEGLDYSQLSFLTGVAIRDTIKSLNTKKDNKIVSKWPNDVLINDKKVDGLLLEFDIMNKNLVIGFGININTYPTNTIFPATSLLNEGIITEKYEFLKAFLENFSYLLSLWLDVGFSIIREKWLGGCYRLGEEIKVDNQVGIFETLDNDGTLILKLPNGEIRAIKSGDIFK